MPSSWDRAHDDGTFGNRFDDPGADRGIPETERFRTIYCATQRVAAFGETIARYRPSLSLLKGLEEDVDDDEEPLNLESGVIPLDWRLSRNVGKTLLDPNLRFVDIAAGETIQHLRPVCAEAAIQLGLEDVDLSAVTSSRRLITQVAARYIHEQVDENGHPLYAGIRYVSRLNRDWECWALFDTRLHHTPEAIVEPIRADDPGLVEAARFLGLTIE